MHTMRTSLKTHLRLVLCLLAFFCLIAPLSFAQKAGPKNEPPAAAPTQDVTATRDQLLETMKLSPKLTGFVARDPMLLADQDFVSRNNPQLSEFLKQHPEVVKNPEFYLFANMPAGRNRELRLEHDIWPEMNIDNQEPWHRDVIPFMVFVIVLAGLLWLVRVLMETRRWSRTFKVQTEMYNKMLDKFSSNEELLAYVQSASGRRFLESATLPKVAEPRTGGAISRILTPLQIGVIVTLMGLGLLHLRTEIHDQAVFAFGTLALAIGIGFIISAALAWALAKNLGILSQEAATANHGSSDDGASL